MTTKYSVKKCKIFGFAQSLKNAELGVKERIKNKQKVFYLHSSENYEKLESLNGCVELTNIEDLEQYGCEDGVVLVELGFQTTKPRKIPVSYDDSEIINKSTDNSEFRRALMLLNSDSDESKELKEHKFSNDFLVFLIELYPNLRDFQLKKSIIEVLNYNNYNTIELEHDYPFEFETKDMEIILSAPMFDDIEVSVDSEEKNISTSLYKPDKDALRKAALGKTTQLDAFSENKFAIIHTKKHAGIDTKIRNQNHDVLDTLAVNGVMKSPDTKKPLSVFKLMKVLEKFNNFSIIFIHPSYEVKYMLSEYPCEQIIPSYKINEGEILAVIYRYLVMNFFGYCSIFTDSMIEWRYYI